MGGDVILATAVNNMNQSLIQAMNVHQQVNQQAKSHFNVELDSKTNTDDCIELFGMHILARLNQVGSKNRKSINDKILKLLKHLHHHPLHKNQYRPK